jgi:hypothetical protein
LYSFPEKFVHGLSHPRQNRAFLTSPVLDDVKVKRDQGYKYEFRIPKNAVATEESKKENNGVEADKINEAFVFPDKIQEGHTEKINEAETAQDP